LSPEKREKRGKNKRKEGKKKGVVLCVSVLFPVGAL
jgi:hypothetical protein